MAGYSAHSLLPGYLAFDSSWWRDSSANLFVYNTTGIPSKRANNLKHPNLTKPQGPEIRTFTSETGKPEDLLIRALVYILNINLQHQQPYYNVVELDEQDKLVSH